MAAPEVNYKSLNDRSNPFRESNDDIESPNENEDTPRTSGIMIHMVPETNRARWNHIEDLDSFFTRMYYYHQKHGFTVIVIDEVFHLCQLAFVVWLVTFAMYCINFPILFGDKVLPNNSTKVTLNDVIIPMGQCVRNFTALTYTILFLATLYFMFKLIKMLYHITQYSDIKKFYNTALQIDDSELDNITWHEIKKKIREVQSEQQMCIDKEQLTELDIYHRILRFKNYMVALMNKNLLPVRLQIPILGEFVTLSRSLTFNIDFILFRGPGSPFQNSWQLRDDYTLRNNQGELAHKLSNLILYVALVNLVLAPIIFIWQCIYFSFQYVNILRREPSALGMRTWSNYGRLYLRHFNELEHELDARLNRAYEPADKYLNSFSSPIMSVLAKNLLFFSGGFFLLIVTLGIFDDYVFHVEHVVTILAALSAIGVVCRNLIPDENQIWCPEQLLTAVLAHVHYLPSNWKSHAHTKYVRQEFGHFFQFKGAYLLNEICSPLVTPFVLIFVFRPKALEIVKFFKSFTVTVKGVGNVCSFAQMDVRKHGNPDWQPRPQTIEPNKNFPTENGKTELSLVHFTLTNPEWRMPPESKLFMKSIRTNAMQDLLRAKTPEADTNNRMVESLVSFGTIGEEYTSVVNSIFSNHHITGSVLSRSMYPTRKESGPINVPRSTVGAATAPGSDVTYGIDMLQDRVEDMSPSDDQECDAEETPPVEASTPLEKSIRMFNVRKSEGRLEGPSNGLFQSIYGPEAHLGFNPADLTTADMCLSTLYLHEVHRKLVRQRAPSRSTWQATDPSERRRSYSVIVESTPLLRTQRS